ncbi:uncharacterized protein ACRADG_005683 isoform 2-T2 [Cochliomyia hominivorax]
MVSYTFEGHQRLWSLKDEPENEKIFASQSRPTGENIPSEIKPSYLPNAEYDVEKWPLTQLMRLLRLYAAHRCLWDVNCRDNRNRKMRHAALVDITAALDFGVSKEQVVQKINILRATYRYEKKRIKQRIRRGLGARTKLKWFALADAFLRNVPKKGQKDEDPTNSDSDLDDTIVFTINPESLVPLEPEYNTETSLDSDDSQSNNSWDIESTNEIKTTENEEVKESNPQKLLDVDHHKTQDKFQIKLTSWSLSHTFKFLQLLDNYKVLGEGSLEITETQKTALEFIAKEMNLNYKSIEKRWLILQKSYQEEIEKIRENPLYEPKYKWWSEAEKLFKQLKDKDEQAELNILQNPQNVPTEAIFLPETQTPESSDDEDYESKFLQNPIPSVAPLSNMNEAMASLFYSNNDDDEDISQESNTNSTFPKDNDSSSSAKFVWQGLEDDLLEGKWSLKHSVKFLRLYGVHRCLWDLNDPDYRSRPLRNAAIEDIAASMGHGLTASYVAKKIKIFRITYMQQRKRLLEATEKGEKPEILLKWFPLADSFLRPHIGLRSIKSDAKEMPQFDYQYVYANLNLIDPALLTDFRGKGTQNAIEIGNDSDVMDMEEEELEAGKGR